jgi:hypothetical protein
MTDVAPRRSRRKPQALHSAGFTTRVRRSPIVKGQRRRPAHPSIVVLEREINSVLIKAQNQSRDQGLCIPFTGYMVSNEGSGAESISPEALPDSLIDPPSPPLPTSACHAPALQPQTYSVPASVAIYSHQGPCASRPATPASLMSVRKSQQHNGVDQSVGPHSGSGQFQIQSQDQTGMLEDVTLPPAAAASAHPAPSRVDTTLSGGMTPRLAPAINGIPRVASSMSTTASLMFGPIQTPSIAATPSFSGKRLDRKRSQPTNKRAAISTSSVLVGPAIRTKTSPSIKPLLPEGGTCC